MIMGLIIYPIILAGKDFFRSLNFGGAPENKTSQITSNIPSVNIPNPSEVVASKGDGLSALPSFMGTTQVEQGMILPTVLLYFPVGFVPY